jgi:hypothetical protein
MNIRKIAQFAPNYCHINREERNYAAIFFAALCKPGNAMRFLRYCGFDGTIAPDFGIYFEYAYLRDLWSNIQDENIRKEIIRQNLNINRIDEILNLPLKEINQKFGVGGEASSEYLQYPGKWAIVKYNKNFPDNDDFRKICRFKWSFNIKPDIVIHLDKDHAICIEAKYESGEGSYPGSDMEKSIFKNRGIEYVGQMELQKYMMEELLGVKTDFMLLVFKKKKSETHKVVSWMEAFGSIDMDEMPGFAVEMARKISG